MRDDLPEPDTPVTQTNMPSGMVTSMFLRLFSRAPMMDRYLPLPGLRTAGTAIFRLPDKNAPVSESGFAATSDGVPHATILPPWTPAPGPTSMR